LKAADKPTAPVAEAAQPEPTTAKAHDISIHKAATLGNIEAVKQHLAAGADVNAKDKYGRTPLHTAVDGDYKELIELLIAEGADVNANSKIGTPLHSAAFWGQKEIAELLIAEGADVNAKDVTGETPLDGAVFNGFNQTVALLREHGGKTGEELNALIDAAEEGNIEAVKQHLAAGMDVNAKDDFFGRTPLQEATWRGHKEIVELLIAKGADVNAKKKNGATPLHEAAAFDHKEIVELLIANGADVNAKDDEGRMPLDEAAGEIADLLRKHGGKTGDELKAEGK